MSLWRTLLLSGLPLACGLQVVSQQNESIVRRDAEEGAPRVAMLLVGLMKRLDENNWWNMVKTKIVVPHKVDIFIHTSQEGKQMEAIHEMDDYVVELVDVPATTPPSTQADLQFWHFKEAFKLMHMHEYRSGWQYNVVIKMRTDISPWGNGYLSLKGYETGGSIHMMTDWMFWGRRDDMEKVTTYWDNLHNYFQIQYPHAMGRPIDVKAMYESIKRDPRQKALKYLPPNDPTLHRSGEDWHSYNKIDVLPYPDEGKLGALANLKAALDRGKTKCVDGLGCTTRCGDRLYFENKDGRWCDGGGDYDPSEIRSESALLAWIQSRGLVICDIGASMSTINFKGVVEQRHLASDC